MQTRQRTLLAGAFFLSGAAGLIDEVVWSRMLHLVFGSTTYSITVVIATYMAGLGLGGLVFGRIADRTARPVRLYALLEIAIGIYALLSPWILAAVRALFVQAHGPLASYPTLELALKAVLASLVLLLPTVLMGGTLPILGRELVGAGDDARRGVGSLYAINTLGAVAGASLAGFFLIEHVGLRGSLVVAAAANGLAAGLALLRGEHAGKPEAAAKEPGPQPLWLLREPRVAAIAALALGAGLGSLAAEVAWARVLALVLGSSTYAFTTVLLGFLLGIGLGAAIAARRLAGREPLSLLAVAQLLAAAGVASLFVLFEPAIRFLVWIQQNPLVEFRGIFLAKIGIVLAVVLPATIGMGMSFPLLVGAVHRRRAVGAEIGLVYAANTLGSIAGAVLAGFVLIQAVGSHRTLGLAALVHLGVATGALLLAGSGLARTRRAALVAASAALAAGVVTARPWPQHLMTSGAFLYARGVVNDPLDVERFLATGRGRIPYFREGLSSLVAVIDGEYSRALRINGKSDASTGEDMQTQLNFGIKPMLAAESPRRVLVIGAGSGVTVRALLHDPRVETLDLIEIEAAVIGALPHFDAANGKAYADPRVRIHVEDGRNFLLTSKARYDVIVSEPSNPWMAGVANLFTREYYALAASRLAKGGVFAQWVQQYDVEASTLRRMAATITASFPETQLWQAARSDLLFLCGDRPLVFSRERAVAYLGAASGFRRELQLAVRAEEADDLLTGRVLDREGLAAYAQGAQPFRDDPPVLEFQALRTVGDTRMVGAVYRELVGATAGVRTPLATLEPMPPEFDAYAAGRVRLAWGDAPGAVPLLVRAAQASPAQATRWYWLGIALEGAGDAGRARAAWQQGQQADPGHAPVATALARTALAAGRPDEAEQALAAIDPARRDPPAALVEAELAVRVGDGDRALARLDEAAPYVALLPDPTAVLQRMIVAFQAIPVHGGDRERLERMLALAARWPSPVAWAFTSAAVLERAGEPARALALYDAVLERGPDLRAVAGKARCLVALGRRDEAVAAIRAAWRHRVPDVELDAVERTLGLDGSGAG